MSNFEYVFVPVIVLLGIFLVVISARFVFRFALFFAAVFALWYMLYAVGLAPSPIDYFKQFKQSSQEIPQLKSLHVRDFCNSKSDGLFLRFKKR